MAKRRKDTKPTIPERVSLQRSLTRGLLREIVLPAPLTAIEDRRTYHPLKVQRPARTISGHPSGPVTPKKTPTRSRAFVAHGLKFPDPTGRVVICVRRKQRREVLFAKKKTRAGARARARRRNWYSNIGC